MVKTDPLYGLSIRRTVDFYTVIVFVGFAFFLFWLGAVRCQDYMNAHQRSADKATQIAAREVNNIIINKRRVVKLFSVDHGDLIYALYKNPDDPTVHEGLDSEIYW